MNIIEIILAKSKIHCCKVNNYYFKRILSLQYHIPTFLIMSFYFFYNSLLNRNINKIKQRFERLLIPYIMWPIILFILDNILYRCFSFSRFNRKLLLNELLLQLLFGITIHPIFWFQFDLIFFTFFFSIISFIFKSYFLFIVHILMIISYIMQYSHIIYFFFLKFKKKHNRYMGSLIDILPYTVTGLSLCSFNLINKFKIKRFRVILFNLIIIYIITKYNIFNKPKGFRYPGIEKNIGGICIFITFSIIPFDKIKNKYILSLIAFITNYTGGIYYIHDILRDYLNKRIIIIKYKTILGGFLIYLVSYLICFLGKILFGETKLKNLFF